MSGIGTEERRRSPTVFKLATLFGGVLLSKALGLLREVTFAFAFGTSYVADAFRVALGAILIPTHVLTGEALFGAFVPAYKRLPSSQRPELVQIVASALLLLSGGVALVLVIGALPVVNVLAPGFHENAIRLCVRLLRVMAIGLILYAVSALLINIQIARDNYSLYSARPSVQNIGILAAVIAAYVWDAPIILGFGFVLAFVVMTLWALHRNHGLQITGLFRLNLRWPKDVTGDFTRALGQLSLFVVLTQLSAAIDRIVGSLTGEGGVAALEYAFFVADSARFVIAVPLATFVLGRLSGLRWDFAQRKVERTLSVLLVGSVTLSVLLWSAARDITTLLYQRGEFQVLSTQLTAASLEGFAVGVWAATAAYVLQRMFNATLRNREVAVAGALGLASNIILDLLLYRPLGVLGIAVATSFSNVLLFALLLHWSGLSGRMLRRAAIPMLAISGLALPLQSVEASGLTGLLLNVIVLAVGSVVVCLAWKPIREDIAYLIRQAFPDSH